MFVYVWVYVVTDLLIPCDSVAVVRNDQRLKRRGHLSVEFGHPGGEAVVVSGVQLVRGESQQT
jgi:hypothetical protein